MSAKLRARRRIKPPPHPIHDKLFLPLFFPFPSPAPGSPQRSSIAFRAWTLFPCENRPTFHRREQTVRIRGRGEGQTENCHSPRAAAKFQLTVRNHRHAILRSSFEETRPTAYSRPVIIGRLIHLRIGRVSRRHMGHSIQARY